MNSQICIDLLNKLTKDHMDERFEMILEEATNVAHKLNIEVDFPPISTILPRRKPTQIQHEHSDEVLLDPKIKYKVEFFLEFLMRH